MNCGPVWYLLPIYSSDVNCHDSLLLIYLFFFFFFRQGSTLKIWATWPLLRVSLAVRITVDSCSFRPPSSPWMTCTCQTAPSSLGFSFTSWRCPGQRSSPWDSCWDWGPSTVVSQGEEQEPPAKGSRKKEVMFWICPFETADTVPCYLQATCSKRSREV